MGGLVKTNFDAILNCDYFFDKEKKCSEVHSMYTLLQVFFKIGSIFNFHSACKGGVSSNGIYLKLSSTLHNWYSYIKRLLLSQTAVKIISGTLK